MPYNRYNVIGVSATSLTKEIFGESEDAWSDEEDFAMEDEEVQDDYGSVRSLYSMDLRTNVHSGGRRSDRS